MGTKCNCHKFLGTGVLDFCPVWEIKIHKEHSKLISMTQANHMVITLNSSMPSTSLRITPGIIVMKKNLALSYSCRSHSSQVSLKSISAHRAKAKWAKMYSTTIYVPKNPEDTPLKTMAKDVFNDANERTLVTVNVSHIFVAIVKTIPKRTLRKNELNVTKLHIDCNHATVMITALSTRHM